MLEMIIQCVFLRVFYVQYVVWQLSCDILLRISQRDRKYHFLLGLFLVSFECVCVEEELIKKVLSACDLAAEKTCACCTCYAQGHFSCFSCIIPHFLTVESE